MPMRRKTTEEIKRDRMKQAISRKGPIADMAQYIPPDVLRRIEEKRKQKEREEKNERMKEKMKKGAPLPGKQGNKKKHEEYKKTLPKKVGKK